MPYRLEKYKGRSSRHRCPGCGKAGEFARYENAETGAYLADDVGRCNRESACGYHLSPREHFERGPQPSGTAVSSTSERPARAIIPRRYKNPLGTIPREVVFGTLEAAKYAQNDLFRFLMNLFVNDQAAVVDAFRKYLVGTWSQGEAVFWQIDEVLRVRSGKIIPYAPETGKRRKDRNPNWIHSILKKAGKLPGTFELAQCFFGQHLIRQHPNGPIAVVEAEKTALVASICRSALPGMIWLACGGKSSLTVKRLLQLGSERRIVLYPDADAFDRWTDVSLSARGAGLDVRVSPLIDRTATQSQRKSGWDLADLLIELQSGKVRALASAPECGEALGGDPNAEREERMAIMTIEGGMTEKAARAYMSSSGLW